MFSGGGLQLQLQCRRWLLLMIWRKSCSRWNNLKANISMGVEQFVIPLLNSKPIATKSPKYNLNLLMEGFYADTAFLYQLIVSILNCHSKLSFRLSWATDRNETLTWLVFFQNFTVLKNIFLNNCFRYHSILSKKIMPRGQGLKLWNY